MVEELNTDLREIENRGLVLREAQRKGATSQLQRWELGHLNDDGGTLKLEEALNKKLNYSGDVFMMDWDGEARKKYGHLAPPGYFEAVKQDADR